ncbi:MAG: ABC transporter substrate-binding protein [Solirubrobacterales bacterium]|nr:ABC transporter substrate-binding protein [Solirubrobacterales bacterium]
MSRPSAIMTAAAVAGALVAAGCGGGRSAPRTAVHKQCRASIGFEGPLSTTLGKQQLAFARLAVADDNSSHHTRITLVAADTRMSPVMAAAVSNQFAAGQKVVAVMGPGTNREVDAVGSIFARAGIGFVSASATGSALTLGANPTFFRVVPSDSLQGPQEATFVASRLRPRAVMIMDDQTGDSRLLVQSMIATFHAARIIVYHVPATPGLTPLGQLATRVTLAIPVVVLAWQIPSAAQQFGRVLAQQRKAPTLVGPNPLFAPGTFAIPGSYISSPVPDITAIPADDGVVLRAQQALGGVGIDGPPAYAATHVIDAAIAAVCRGGQPPAPSTVLAAVRSTNEPTSILGIPIRFRTDGNLADGRWFMFQIRPSGRYHMVTAP